MVGRWGGGQIFVDTSLDTMTVYLEVAGGVGVGDQYGEECMGRDGPEA